MARPKPPSKKRIREIENDVFNAVDRYFELLAKVDALDSGVELKNYLNKEYGAAKFEFRNFLCFSPGLTQVLIVRE